MLNTIKPTQKYKRFKKNTEKQENIWAFSIQTFFEHNNTDSIPVKKCI